MPDYPPPDVKPKILLVINGKRKSGKDFVTDQLLQRLEKEKVAVFRIAVPIKHYWAVKNNLDFERLLDTSAYKEQHRFEMVKWSMEVRAENYGYFPVEAIKMANAYDKPIWICTDCRHSRDYEWFQEFYPDCLKRIKIRADESVRSSRGFKFTTGVDDGPSECDLDHVTNWDLVVSNNGSEGDNVEESLNVITNWIEDALKAP
ncbi:Phosphomevalonate kinase [Orchesella cincta]|uniref:Phosphomevalonate kinase n=1 Tax=Orchesella cincta TaxID=48709 RepID=A0A1D2MZ39_ORCCI|nr:Phosphomevalonate kinase [Orchesella cincta]